MRLIHERSGRPIAFPLDEGETLIGRSDDCQVSFPDASLSKQHARLVRRGPALTCFDAGSRNGTLMNGRPVGPQGVAVRTGDVVQCGKLAFRVEGVDADDYAVLDDAPGPGRRRLGSKEAMPVARPVRSAELRASALDALPEVPPSVERAAAPGPAGARLALVEGGPPRTWDLTGETITIGSKAENAVCISGEGVSRYHAEVTREGSAWLLKDLGARNGVFVKEQKVDIHELQDGDDVQIGTVKLRFSLVVASPLGGAGALASRLLADPIGVYKAEPRLRVGLAATVVAVLLLGVALLGGPRPDGANDGVGGAWCDDATGMLERGEYEDAKRTLRRALNQLPQSEQELPRALGNVAAHWCDLPRGAQAFRWDKADELLSAALRARGLSARARAWLEGQQVTVTLEKAAAETLAEAEITASAALAMAADKRFREAVKKLEAVAQLYAAIPARSVYSARARTQAAALRAQAFVLMLAEVKARMAAPAAEWSAVIEFIGKTEALTDEAAQRTELQRLRGECQANQRDEQLYQRAVDICDRRDVARYAEALRWLAQIDQRSRIRPDAAAYVQWIEADQAVRQAQREYQMGDEKHAQALLSTALAHDALGPAAIQSISQRRTTWARVARAFQAGMELFNQGKHEEAQAEFARVVQFEPDRSNRYNVQALQQIQHIAQLKNLDLENKLRHGLDALGADDFEGASRFFDDVRRDPNHQDRDLQRIVDAVVEANRARRLLATSQREFTADKRESFVRIDAITDLLARWLPASDKDRVGAEKLHGEVQGRLRLPQQAPRPR